MAGSPRSHCACGAQTVGTCSECERKALQRTIAAMGYRVVARKGEYELPGVKPAFQSWAKTEVRR